MGKEITSTQRQYLAHWKNASTNSKALTCFSEKKKMLTNMATNELTVADAVQSGAHLKLLHTWNFKETMLCVSAMVGELMAYVPNQLTGEQLVSIAESIILDNPEWKPDDILIILRNGKQGKYGKQYGNWSYQTFNEWADAYAIERQAYFDNRHLDVKESSTTRADNKNQVYKERGGGKFYNQTAKADENYFKQFLNKKP